MVSFVSAIKLGPNIPVLDSINSSIMEDKKFLINFSSDFSCFLFSLFCILAKFRHISLIFALASLRSEPNRVKIVPPLADTSEGNDANRDIRTGIDFRIDLSLIEIDLNFFETKPFSAVVSSLSESLLSELLLSEDELDEHSPSEEEPEESCFLSCLFL